MEARQSFSPDTVVSEKIQRIAKVVKERKRNNAVCPSNEHKNQFDLMVKNIGPLQTHKGHLHTPEFENVGIKFPVLK